MFGTSPRRRNATIPVRNEKGENFHYLRAMGPLNPESARDVQQPSDQQPQQRLQPASLGQGPHLRPPQLRHPPVQLRDHGHAESEHAQQPAFNERTSGNAKEATDFFERLKQYVFAEQSSTGSVPAPGCTQQAPFKPIYGSGPATTYQHTFEQTGE